MSQKIKIEISEWMSVPDMGLKYFLSLSLFLAPLFLTPFFLQLQE